MQEPSRLDHPPGERTFAFDPAVGGPPGGAVEAGPLLLTVGGGGSAVSPAAPDAGAAPRPRRPAAPASAGPDGPAVLLGRDLEIAELRPLLEGHVHVRLRGPSGVGRTALLDRLAARVAAQAPDGLIRLDGRGHDLDDLLQQLHDTCLAGPPRRWDRRAAARANPLREVAGLVVVDDLDLPDPDVRLLLAAVPESVFLVAGPGESPESLHGHVLGEERSPHAAPFHDLVLTGLPRDAAVTLVEQAAGRALNDDERAWARALAERVDGHPGRLLQVAGLLRLSRRRGAAAPAETGLDLPALVDPQLLGSRLVAQLDDHARRVVRLGAVLGGALPGPAHLPAMIGADDPAVADAALATLVACGLAVREQGRHRLATGISDVVGVAVRGQSSWAVAAIQHYSAWLRTGVPAADVVAEAPALLAALAEGERHGQGTPVRALARAVAPVFALAMCWGAWETALRCGLAAARSAGATADEAWFRHELAVRALCAGDRATAREEAAAAARLRGPGAGQADLRLRDLADAEEEAASGPAVPPDGRAGGGHRRVMIAGSAALVTVFAVTMAVVVAGSGSGDEPGTPRVPVGVTRAPVAEVMPGDGDGADTAASVSRSAQPTASETAATTSPSTRATGTRTVGTRTTAPRSSAPARSTSGAPPATQPSTPPPVTSSSDGTSGEARNAPAPPASGE